MFSVALRALTARLADPPVRPKTGAPGPMGLANADRIREVLTVAGWSAVTIAPRDGSCDYAIDGSDGVEELLAVALSSTFGRAVRPPEPPSTRTDGKQCSTRPGELRAQLVDGAVRLPGYTWLVTATNR